MDNVKNNFIAVRKFIETGWTQGQYARNRVGDIVPSNSPLATCFCLMGACLRVASNQEELDLMRTALLLVLGPDETITNFNDAEGRTKEDVLHVIDQVIARIK